MAQPQQLKEEFPDITQSTINDIITATNNVDEAKQMLRTFADEPKRERESKIQELQGMFSSVPKEVIIQILDKYKYDIDAAIVPLFNEQAEIQKREQAALRKQREQEEKKKREDESKKQCQELMRIFHNIPKETIQKILDDNEGDIQDTTDQLLALVSKQEEAQLMEDKKKREEELKQKERERQSREQDRIRNIKIDALKEKFEEMGVDQIVNCLESTKWDIKEACKVLMAISAEKKKTELKSLFQSFSDIEIQETLQANDWNVVSAARELSTRREVKTHTEQIKQKEQPSIVITRIQQSILAKSIMLGKTVEEEIHKEEEEKNRLREQQTKEQFKKDLGAILAIQAQNGTNGMPGLVPPPTPKQIDKLIKKPVEEEPAQVVPASPSSVKESPVQSPVKVADNKNLKVTLVARPTRVDIGNTVTCEWEVLAGASSASDWIGFFAVDQPNKQYITYEWRGKQESKGIVTFTAPSNYGVYEFRYFPASCYEHVAMSNQITVGPEVEISCTLDAPTKKIKVLWNQKSGNQNRRAWCGLYEQSQTNNKQFIAWEYVANPNTELLFDAPVKPGSYEVRFFASGYVDIAKSNAVVIEGQDKLSASIANGIISVKMNIVSVNPATDSVWLGVFFIQQTDNKQWRRYKYIYDRATDVTFQAPKHGGIYEVRLFANKSFDCRLKSNSFEVPDRM